MSDGHAGGASPAGEEDDFSNAMGGQSGNPTSALRALRARWRTASLASGWKFPSDWAVPEVDAVCATVMKEGVTETAMSGLAKARAESGAGLDETLTDLAALHAVLTETMSQDGFVVSDVDAMPARFVRVTARAWADVALDQFATTRVTDALTGLPTAAYLRTRLAEVYARAGRDGSAPSEGHVLLAVSLNLADVTGWPRLTGMILLGEALRSVFDGGESMGVLGPSTVVALAEREDGAADRAVRLRRDVHQRFRADPQLSERVSARIRVLRLAPTYDEMCALLGELARG